MSHTHTHTQTNQIKSTKGIITPDFEIFTSLSGTYARQNVTSHALIYPLVRIFVLKRIEHRFSLCLYIKQYVCLDKCFIYVEYR